MKIHISGVAGAGMSNLARLAIAAGHRVVGSDRRRSSVMDQLLKAGAAHMLEHQNGEHVRDADLLVRSTAIADDNPDIVTAREHGLPVWTRMQYLARLVQEHETIAVAGSFGKSSMAALMADVLVGAGTDPTAYVGATLPTLGSGARWGSGRLAVVEACEYRRELLHLAPRHLLLTNLAINHEDEFGSDMTLVTRLFNSFLQINASRLETLWVAEHCAGVRRLCLDGMRGVQTWGTPTSMWFSQSLGMQDNLQRLILRHQGRDAGVFLTSWQGQHVGRSLAPVLGMAKLLGLDDRLLQDALLASRPLPRRYEIVHSEPGLEIVDDNARLPDQVATTIASARVRAGAEGRVVVVLGIWGTLNRRNLAAYAAALTGCDEAHVLPSARFEISRGGLEPDGADALLVKLIQARGADARCLESPEELDLRLSPDRNTIVLTMGYESFAEVFRSIHDLWRKRVDAIAPV